MSIFIEQQSMIIIIKILEYFVLFLLSAFLFPTCLSVSPTAGILKIIEPWNVSADYLWPAFLFCRNGIRLREVEKLAQGHTANHRLAFL